MRDLDGDDQHGGFKKMLVKFGYSGAPKTGDWREYAAPTHKLCKDCVSEGIGPIPISEFGKVKGSKDGHSHLCKRHRRVYQNAYYHAGRRKMKDRMAERVAKGTGVPIEQVQKVVKFIRNFRHRNIGRGQMAEAMRSWR